MQFMLGMAHWQSRCRSALDGHPMARKGMGFVLGDLMEQNLRRALSITNGDASILVQSPISIDLWMGAALMVVVPPVLSAISRRKAKPATGAPV